MGTLINTEALKSALKRDEAVRNNPYDDATGKVVSRGDIIKGKITIGVGRNLTDVGLSDDEIDYLLANDMRRAIRDLDRNMMWWRGLPSDVQQGLANMSFNMGWPRLSGFKKMIHDLKIGAYAEAADEAMNSVWARQVGDRAKRIEKLFREAV